MPFTIPDNDVAGDADQAVWFSTDIAILVAALAGVGVLTGCAVTAQVSPNMTLAVAAGTTKHTAGSATVTAGNVTITTAHATLPRIDLVSVSNTGVKTVTAGTAATEPKPPALPADHVALAMVHVPGGDTQLQTAQIVDKRAVVVPTSSLTRALTFIIDGGAAPITTGIKGVIEIPFACTITAVRLFADQVGSIVVDLYKDTYANYPPVVGDKITASAPPTISSADKSQDTTLTGWTTAILGGDILLVNVNSVTNIQRLTLSLLVTLT